MEKQGFKTFLTISIIVHLCIVFLVGNIPFKQLKGPPFTIDLPTPPSKQEKKSSNSNSIKHSAVKSLKLTSINNRIKNSITYNYEDNTPTYFKREDTITLDTRDPKYFPYSAKIKRKIELVWEYPSEAREEEIKGKLTLKFSILRNGELEGLQLIQSSGFPVLDNGAFNAVKLAAPYYPIPQTMEINKLNVIATFEYRLDY
ncbi:MAG: energy transducer TonB [Pseudomonadota bacterium]